ncbi:MAG: hypothetical protein JOY96_07140 [Verrucomicrobia bacterium]|nr:hypothetical protein [Verrucomicrobiota bacterium]MBV9673958.1 hypothetical protein [Verrucomicrobiota bacterium]
MDALIPASVDDSLTRIEAALRRFRSCYYFGGDPAHLLAEEIISMRIELLRLWCLVDPENNRSAPQ